MIFDAASRRPRSEFQVFCYSDIPESLADHALNTHNLQVTSGREAILGCVRGEWEPPKDPPPYLWVDNQFGLGDFANLSAYLARSVIQEPEGETLMRDFLEKIITKSVAEGGTRDDA